MKKNLIAFFLGAFIIPVRVLPIGRGAGLSTKKKYRKKNNLLSSITTQAMMLVLALGYYGHANAVSSWKVSSRMTGSLGRDNKDTNIISTTPIEINNDVSDTSRNGEAVTRGNWVGRAGPGVVLSAGVNVLVTNADTKFPGPSGGISVTSRAFVGDMIFSGPDGFDSTMTNLNMKLSGAQELSLDIGNEVFFSDATFSTVRISYLFVDPASINVLYRAQGQRTLKLNKDGLDSSLTGVLADNKFQATGMPEGIKSGDIIVPIGVPLTLGMELEVEVGANISIFAEAKTRADFVNTFKFPETGPVFDLPEGFTVNSVQAGIVNNRYVPADPKDGSDCPSWICRPNINGWRSILYQKQP